MKKKWIVICAVFLGCTALLIKCGWAKYSTPKHLCIKEPYFHAVETTTSSAYIPHIEIEIAGKTIKAAVDLGASYNIALPKEFIQNLDQKTFIQQVSHYGARGKKYKSNVYQLPKIKIGNLGLYDTRVEEIDLECAKDETLREDKEESSLHDRGKIGWRLFYRLNVFLDLEHSKIAFCDSLDTLKKKGYPVDEFVEVPLLLDHDFLEFDAMTDAGPLRCILDTGCTGNMLNKDVKEGSDDHRFFTYGDLDEQHAISNPDNTDQLVFDFDDIHKMSSFKIGKRDFGEITFQNIRMPFDVDAIIGTEFLDDRLVFVDFVHRKLYFY
jgi:hypothetical protein